MLKKLFLELRRREVFRTAGLYIGIAWIVIEVASVLFPAFDLPEQVLRWLVILAVVGFPISLVLAWIFDISDRGIVVQEDATGAASGPVGGYKMDFVVIGVLSVALIVSTYLNFTAAPDSVVAAAPVTILVADIENGTGKKVFDDALAEAIMIAFEAAPLVNVQNRLGHDPLNGLAQPDPSEPFTPTPADAGVLVSGSISADGASLRVTISATDQATGEVLAQEAGQADAPDGVLGVVEELVTAIQEELGVAVADAAPVFSGDTAVTRSVEALQAYSAASRNMRANEYAAAQRDYQQAAQLDPLFARAWVGAAFAAFSAGERTVAEESWRKADALLSRMTAGERQLALGRYHLTLQPDYAKALDNFAKFVNTYPANGAALETLTNLYRVTGQHEKALQQSAALLAMYPQNIALRARHAGYAINVNDMALASDAATALLADAPGLLLPHRILAVVTLYVDDIAAAQGHYRRLAAINAQGASLANSGLADIAAFESRYDDAIALLVEGIATDGAAANDYGVATKRIALAQAYLGKEANADALSALQDLPPLADLAVLVPAAEMFVAQGRDDAARAIATQLRAQTGPRAAAYAAFIDGLVAYRDSDYTGAIDDFRKALRQSDLWLVRFHIAKAYLKAGYPAEASDEFSSCLDRRGEAAALFFDEVATWRYTAPLPAWKAAADRELMGLATAVWPADSVAGVQLPH